MEEVKRRLNREGINTSVFAEENVDLSTFLALTREDFIDLNFSIIKTRKILMIQEEIRSKYATPAAPQSKINKANHSRPQSQSLSDVVQDTIITPTTITNSSTNYSIVTIPAMGCSSTNFDNHQMIEGDRNVNEIDTALVNLNANSDAHSSQGEMVQVEIHNQHDYNSPVPNEIRQQNLSLISLSKRHSEAFRLIENLDFRSLLAQDDQGAILLEVLDRGDYLDKRLPGTLVKVIAVVADEFIYRNFGLRYPYEVGEQVVERIYESIGHRCNLGEKKEWFGLRKNNNRVGRIHSRNEKRKRLNREYNTSLSMETSFIRFKNPKNLKRMLNV